MKKIVIIIGCALLLILGVFTINSRYEKYEENKAVAVLKNKIVKIKTVKAENDFKDLMPLKNILKDKKIVAMGEATHGTKEFFQMKHRMLKFLVEKMDYNVFGIEACMSECMAVNDYVLYGKGEAEQVVKKMGFWTWDTKEVVDMVKWMREYNENHTKKVKFYGFDMQSSCTAVEKVQAYLKKVDKEYENKVDSILLEFKDPKTLHGNNKKLHGNEVKKIMCMFEKNKNEYISKSSKEEYELYKQNLKIIDEAYDFFKGNQSNSQMQTKRDKYMAENIKWILNFEGQDTKIMVWAHNWHVSKVADNINNIGENVKRMGSNLYDMYKDKLYVIGFQFSEGTVTAVDKSINRGEESVMLKKCTLHAAKKGSIPYILSKVDPLFFIDFKSVNTNKYVKEFISTPKTCRYVDANFNGEDESYETNILDQCYDGLIYIDKISNSELI
ncbi:erythromycin esterase family protein [Haloimpatiens sp. FM7330]|uniref:erythromycin esterase family protein n=1 Tax=Haloimpatiens sp. FM7330 TaxID=3298610 RepID=UPI00362E2331